MQYKEIVMEGFNWWGVFSFVLPIALSIIVGGIVILVSIINYLIKGVNNAKRN